MDTSGVLRSAEEVLGAAPPSSPPSQPSSPSPATSSSATSISAAEVIEKKEKLKLFLVDETQTPVAPADRAEAVKRAEEFIISQEVKDAELKGGMSQETAAELYQKILFWLKNNSIPSLENDDPSLDPTLKSSSEDAVRTFYDLEPEDVIQKRANLIAKFARDNGIFDSNQGELILNLFALVTLYDKVKDLSLT